jgi:hypothetical protein
MASRTNIPIRILPAMIRSRRRSARTNAISCSWESTTPNVDARVRIALVCR